MTTGRTIGWNWATVLFWACFITYGYFGARTPTLAQFHASPASATIQLGLLSLILAGFGVLAWKELESWKDSLRLDRRDAAVYLSYLALLTACSFERLGFSLFSDELYFAQQAVRHSLVLTTAVSARFAALDPVPFRHVVQGTSVLIGLTLAGVWVAVRRWPVPGRVGAAVIAFVCLRLAIMFVGGNANPHPSLNLLPPLVFSSLFGVNDVAFKLSSFIPYTFFAFVVCRLALRRCGPATAYLAGLAVSTMPLLWHLSGIVEQSLWGAMCFIVVFLDLLTSESPNYLRLMSVISIAALMRQPAIIAVIPVLLLFGLDALRSRDWPRQIRRAAMVCAPLLLCVPFLLASVILGTPSTPALGQSAGTSGRLTAAIASGIIVTSAVNSVAWWWIALIPFAFVPLARNGIVKNAALLASAAMAIVTYYSIAPFLLGYAKYQAECVVPFAAAGLLCLVARLSASAATRHVVPGALMLLIGANVVSFMRMPEGNKPVDVLVDTMSADMQRMNAGYRGLCALTFNFGDAYRAVRQANLSERTYAMGYTYGTFPEVMHGYSTRAMRTVSDIAKKQREQPGSAEGRPASERVDALDLDSRIDTVLLGFTGEKAALLTELRGRGWRVSGAYRNDRYGSTVFMVRKG